MEFFIVDDNVMDYDYAKSYIAKAFPDSAFIASDKALFTSWKDVYDQVRKHVPAHGAIILVVDLVLGKATGSHPMDAAKAATVEVDRLRLLRPEALILGYTQYSDIAQRSPAFQGVIAKQKLSTMQSDDERTAYVKYVVNEAIARVCGIAAAPKVEFVLNDSLGIRMAQAAFGERFFAAIVGAVASGWTEVAVRAFTSGHGGAHVLLITGKHKGQSQGVVVKCAHDRRVIDAEIQAKDVNLPTLGSLGGHLAAIEGQLHALPGYECYYYRQSHISGDALTDMLRQEGWSTRASEIVRAVADIECGHYANNERFGELAAAQAYVLSKIDVGRATSSLPVLADFGKVMQSIGQWPEDVPKPEDVVACVEGVIVRWDEILRKLPPLYPVAQHGDLNPGNVLIPKRGDVIFIDLARLGVWPVGYDLARLAGMLRYRLVDAQQGRDWIVNDLARWCREGMCQIEESCLVDTMVCPAASYCDQAFRKFVLGRETAERTVLRSGYILGTIWDSIKVLSYVDLAAAKRVWALLVCWQLIGRMGLV